MGIFSKQVVIQVEPQPDNYVTGMRHNGNAADRARLEPLMWETFNEQATPGEYMVVERDTSTNIYAREDWLRGEGQGRPYHLATLHTKTQ